MHTLWVRLNAVVFFGLTVIVSLAVLTWISTVSHRGFPTVDVLRVANVKSLRSHVIAFSFPLSLPLTIYRCKIRL